MQQTNFVCINNTETLTQHLNTLGSEKEIAANKSQYRTMIALDQQ